MVIFDEGIVQVGRITTITEEMLHNGTVAQSKIFLSAIVHLDIANKTYKKRFIENGSQRFHKAGSEVTNNMLDQYIEHFKATNFKKVEVCKSLNIPILELEAKVTRDNFKQLEKFIRLSTFCTLSEYGSMNRRLEKPRFW